MPTPAKFAHLIKLAGLVFLITLLAPIFTTFASSAGPNAPDGTPLDDTYATNEDTRLTVPAPGVLSNDTIVGVGTANLDTPPANGSLTLNPDGGFTYDPLLNSTTAVTFTYTLTDDEGTSAPATVTINLTPVNDPADGISDNYAGTEDTQLTVSAPGVLANDSDIDNLISELSAVVDTLPATGVLNLNPDGSFTYTPDNDLNGPITFTYRVDDGTDLSAPVTVTMTLAPVNDPPVADDDSVNTDEDQAITINVLSGDIGGPPDESQVLDVISATTPANGDAVINVDNTITYTPDANYCGIDTFDYTVEDSGLLTDTGTVTVTVACLEDAPNAVNDTSNISEDTIAVIDVLANDSDPENNIDPTSVSISVPPFSGGTSINPTTGVITYTPEANYFGSQTFTYQVCDTTLICDTAQVQVFITNVNDAPTAVNDSLMVTEDGSNSLDPTLNDNAGPSNENQDLEIQSFTQGAIGTVSENLNTITYTPNANACGSDSFNYTIVDDGGLTASATINVTVTCVNDAPQANDDSVSTNEDTAVVISVLANDNALDVPSDLVLSSLTIVNPASHGSAVPNTTTGQVTYTPASNFFGSDSFTYQICDAAPLCDTALVSITVTSVNDLPFVQPDNASTPEDIPVNINVLGNDFDTDGTLDPTSLTVTVAPPHGTALVVEIMGSYLINYTPGLDFVGTDQFEYEVCDNQGGCNSAQVTVGVGQVNDAPVAVDDSGINTPEDTPVIIDVLANDSDVDGNLNPSSLSIAAQPVNGVASVNVLPYTVTFTPAPNYFGNASFTYQVCDTNLFCDTAVVSITVTAVNDPPIAADDTASVNEDGSVLIDVLTNDFPGPSNELEVISITGLSQPANGSAVIELNQIRYTPAANYCGSNSFFYTIQDAGMLADSAQVVVTVNCQNDTPLIVNDTVSGPEDQVLLIDVLSNDSDIENRLDPDSLTLIGNPFNGDAIVTAGNQISYTPDAHYFGADSLSYEVCDLDGACAAADVAITITPINDSPTAGSDSYIINEDTPTVLDILANDSAGPANEDPALTLVSVTSPSNGVPTANPDGTVLFTPTTNFCGSAGFNYTVADSDDLQTSASVTITVTCINDPPIVQDDSYTLKWGNPLPTELTVPLATGVLANDSDIEGTPLTAEVAQQPLNGTVVMNTNGSFTYTPPSTSFSGLVTFTYRARDGSSTSTGTVTILVDRVLPTVSWVSPVPFYLVTTGDPFLLEAFANDNSGIQLVRFYRYDYVTLSYVELGEDTTAPYTYMFDPDDDYLLPNANQLSVLALDNAGNFTQANLFVQNEYHPNGIFMPLIQR